MIKELRKQYDFTQKELAENVGIPLRTIQSWECGQRTAPEYVYRLIKYYLDTESSKYVIRDREAGNVIDEFWTLDAAEAELKKYEDQDKEDGTYEEDFYEIVKKSF